MGSPRFATLVGVPPLADAASPLVRSICEVEGRTERIEVDDERRTGSGG